MSPIYIGLSVVYGVLCFVLIGAILMQKKRTAGLGGMTGMGGSGQTYWDKNKARSKEGKLETVTKICGVFFFIIPLVLSVVK